MKLPYQVRTIAVGVVLLTTSLCSAGLTLGRAQGLAFVGKPLDMQIQAQFDNNEDLQAVCLTAVVQYGETVLDSARVSATVVQTSGRAGPGHAVRIEATTLIDEPVVTVQLRVGCQEKSAKKYTLFADLPTNVVEPVARELPPAVDVSTGVVQTPLTPFPRVAPPAIAPTPAAPVKPVVTTPRNANPAPVADPAPQPPPPRVAKTRPAPAAVQALEAARRPSKAERAAAKARLKLDPLDLSIDYSPVLRASPELLTSPQEDAQKRSEAAAHWRALNASPQAMVQDEARAHRLEQAIKSLYSVTTENQKGLIDLAAKARQAESERYANGLVYGLITLWVGSLLALVWVWRRLRAGRVRNWADGLDRVDAGDSVMADLDLRPTALAASATAVEPEVAEPPPVAAATLTELDFDLDLMEAAESAVDPTVVALAPKESRRPAAPTKVAAVSPAVARAVGHVDFSLSVSPGARAIDSEELMDARQQAEFFVSLGQHDKAIEILTTRIAQVGESSPLVCLDLLKIYHAMGRASEFEFMRTEFNQWFAGRVPPFADFGNEGRSLDRYPQVMAQIVDLWPRPEVLEFIEGCIYQHGDAGEGEVFDLQAYLELLFLHGVAKRIVRQSDASDDDDATELLRIPARTPGPAGRHPTDSGVSAVAGHRAGAHRRGSRQRDANELPDPEEDLETRGAPLGAMRVPPTPSLPAHAADQPAQGKPSAEKTGLTDFNFLDLR